MKGSLHIFLSAVTIATGILLLAYMIMAEDDPGLVPLLMIVSGRSWLFIAKRLVSSKGK